MADIDIRKSGRAGRITLTRPEALNALTYEMCLAIHAALETWRADSGVDLVVLDGAGDRAFCAGGDIAQMYRTGSTGDFDYGQRFWRDEYRMNAAIAEYPKPIVSFMHGFVMGGGVGLGCHGTYRIVDTETRMAMPEAGIGLIPDVGGTLLLARAPGCIGEYLGLTGARMGPDDAILAGFADLLIPRGVWPALIAELERSGDPACLAPSAQPPPPGTLREQRASIDRLFRGESLPEISAALRTEPSDLAHKAYTAMVRNSPLSMACTLALIRQLRAQGPTIRAALAQEYRFTWRAMEQGDFLEGIRAAIIDKDRQPLWQHQDMNLPGAAVAAMLEPLGQNELTFTTAEGAPS
ncbi:3-hydroxyisobutyryl-CoA hydrolase [Pontibaca salina]|uniref:3-hydroxyisobutyryl-CoA hydrolase n=1 Tax=Pontibaca salina TaxID=2795731 RepID=A0A934HIV7_9RHOB|nr:3-hydroxyisobutyryl-CoA hydrolase [Pontibaca salina]MBI6628984.1 enoyl-CoA hydratase/isomerase family protein [Pontibaca salina]